MVLAVTFVPETVPTTERLSPVCISATVIVAPYLRKILALVASTVYVVLVPVKVMLSPETEATVPLTVLTAVLLALTECFMRIILVAVDEAFMYPTMDPLCVIIYCSIALPLVVLVLWAKAKTGTSIKAETKIPNIFFTNIFSFSAFGGLYFFLNLT